MHKNMYISSVGATTTYGAAERALEYLSGVRSRWTIDNLKAGVHKADREVPQLNASFREFAHPTRARSLVDFAKPRLIVQS